MNLADLIRQVIADDGATVTSIAQRSGLSRSTVSAWSRGTRGAVQPPTRDRLKQLAVGLRRPEPVVLAAAGLPPNEDPAVDLGEVTVMALYRELPTSDQQLVQQIMRAMAARTPA